jgi:hypothetical protein
MRDERWDYNGIAFAFTFDHCTVVGDTCKYLTAALNYNCSTTCYFLTREKYN